MLGSERNENQNTPVIRQDGSDGVFSLGEVTIKRKIQGGSEEAEVSALLICGRWVVLLYSGSSRIILKPERQEVVLTHSL